MTNLVKSTASTINNNSFKIVSLCFLFQSPWHYVDEFTFFCISGIKNEVLCSYWIFWITFWVFLQCCNQAYGFCLNFWLFLEWNSAQSIIWSIELCLFHFPIPIWHLNHLVTRLLKKKDWMITKSFFFYDSNHEPSVYICTTTAMN